MEPVLVRMGRGEVQRRTALLFTQLAPLLRLDRFYDWRSCDAVQRPVKRQCALESFLAMFTTVCHIHIRFNVYNCYPTRLWQMCKKWNPAGYVSAIQLFLDESSNAPDCGYSLPLQARAWAQPLPVQFLMSTSMQDEVEGVLVNSSTHSLDVVRKHFQDKPHDRRTVSGVATASRNSIIRRYRTEKVKVSEQARSAERFYDKTKHLNIRALALKRCPDLFRRGRGRLHWERDVSDTAARAITNHGDEERLQEYIAANRKDFEDEVRKAKDDARAAVERVKAFQMPRTNGEWVTWLEANEEYFRNLLRTATSTRRSLSQRLVPFPEGLPEAHRLQPRRSTAPLPLWKKQLLTERQWFFCVEFGEHSNDKLGSSLAV